MLNLYIHFLKTPIFGFIVPKGTYFSHTQHDIWRLWRFAFYFSPAVFFSWHFSYVPHFVFFPNSYQSFYILSSWFSSTDIETIHYAGQTGKSFSYIDFIQSIFNHFTMSSKCSAVARSLMGNKSHTRNQTLQTIMKSLSVCNMHSPLILCIVRALEVSISEIDSNKSDTSDLDRETSNCVWVLNLAQSSVHELMNFGSKTRNGWRTTFFLRTVRFN